MPFSRLIIVLFMRTGQTPFTTIHPRRSLSGSVRPDCPLGDRDINSGRGWSVARRRNDGITKCGGFL